MNRRGLCEFDFSETSVGIKTGEKGWESIISGKFRRNGVNVRGKSRIQECIRKNVDSS